MPENSSNNRHTIPNTITNTNSNEVVSGQVIFIRNFLLGGFSAAIAVTAMAPIERVKLILQVQNASANVKPEFHYKGLVDCFVRIPREQGFRSFWRGNLASVLRSFPYQALNFAFKDKFKDIFVRNYEKKNHFWRRLGGNSLSGGIAGVSSLCIIYPLDYARTRLAMDQGAYNHTREFKSITSCIKETYKIDGITGLYRGLTFSFFGVFIYRAGFFGIYDTGRDFTPDEYKHILSISFITAEVAAITSGLISYPMDTVRRSMMMQSARVDEKKHYENSFDCVRKLHKTSGIKGFFNGALANIIRGTGGALILVLYGEIHHKLWGHPVRVKVPDTLIKSSSIKKPPFPEAGSVSSSIPDENSERSKSDSKIITGDDDCSKQISEHKSCSTSTRHFDERVFHFCAF